MAYDVPKLCTGPAEGPSDFQRKSKSLSSVKTSEVETGLAVLNPKGDKQLQVHSPLQLNQPSQRAPQAYNPVPDENTTLATDQAPSGSKRSLRCKL